MNDKEFAKAQASIMNKKTKLVQLKDDRAEACKKINEIEQEIAKSESSNIERMKHVIKIDQHRPFTDKAVQKLLRFIKPDYVVHELAYRDFSDFEKNIEVQLTACGRKLSIDDEGD